MVPGKQIATMTCMSEAASRANGAIENSGADGNGADGAGAAEADALFAQLSEDVDFLGRVLGTVLREFEGADFFDLVERVRGLTKGLREGPMREDLKGELAQILSGLDLAQTEGLVRAFTVYFQLINLAEEIHRIRVNRIRERRATEDNPKSESVAAAIKHLKDQGWSHDRVRKFVNQLDIQLTLTAHPTEVKRYTVRLKLERIASALRHLREWDLGPLDRRALRDEIHAEVATLWRTRELFARKPTVLDEVKSALYYFRRSLLDAVPRLHGDFERALRVYYGDAKSGDEPDELLSPVIRFRSWIGGDRDGNPFVTPEITEETYRLQGQVAVERHVADVDLLVQRLSQWGERLPDGESLERVRRELEELAERCGPSSRFAGEPFRRRLFYVHRELIEELERLGATGPSPEAGSEECSEVVAEVAAEVAAEPVAERRVAGRSSYAADLATLDQALRAGGDVRAADAFVRPVQHRVAAFGLHLAALDLREHSRHHERAVDDLLRQGGVVSDYRDLAEAERIEVLVGRLEAGGAETSGGDILDGLEAETVKALEFLRVFARVQDRLGAQATGGYVVSMTEGVSDILEVLVLAQAVGVEEIDAVPLFETVADLENAPGIVSRLLAIPAYRRHLERRGLQEVMIGYSDSNKDAGFLAANWALYQAQEGIAEVCRQAGVSLRIFHGRGTSIGRGGGPAGQAILAQPPGSLGGRMRITEQGEALDNRYSDPDLAHRHLEQVAHAFLLSSAQDDAKARPSAPEEYREAITRAAQAAKARYRGLLEADGFLDFYHSVTPIDEISRLDIGSRPARRKGDPSLSNLRAIPWVFSWTQCRANLPGWFSLGSGLEVVSDALLVEMYREWPFFRTLLDFAQMSLAKADFAVFDRYLMLVEGQELRDVFGTVIHEEFARTVSAITRATGVGLLDGDPTLARSIRLRNPYVDPISHCQVELLRRLRSLPEDALEREALDYAVKLSLVGVSAGMRNTG